VGMGIVINGQLFRGYESKAGEFVNFVYQEGKQIRQLDIGNEDLMQLNDNISSLKLFINNYVDKLLFTNALLNPRTIYLGGDSEIWNEHILKSIGERFPDKNEEDIKSTFCFSFLENTEDDIAYGASQLMLDFLFHMPYLNSKEQTWEQNPSPLLDGI
jgi:predicted NBD/HSP70 family sugar kinase